MKKYNIQTSPFVVPTTDGKLIEEHFGKATDGNSEISIAHMIAPPHWSEPFQRPEFAEYTYIIRGKKQFIIEDELVILETGQSIKIKSRSTNGDIFTFVIKRIGILDFSIGFNFDGLTCF